MPESAQLNILLETGADFILPYTIYDDDDNPIDLTGATVRAYLRESAAAPDYYEFLCRHNDAGGRITITMPHETTSEITFTSGVYDVVVVFEDGTTSYPLHGDATIRQGITKITDGNVLFMIGISNYEDLPEIGNVDRLYFSYDDQVIYRWNGMNYIATAVGRGVTNITAELHGNIITYTFTYTDGTTSTIDLDYNLLDSPSFTGTPTAPTPESGDDSTRIATTEYVTDAISTASDTKADVSDIAPAFDETKNYLINNYVTYNGDFYRFIADHTAGAWNPAEVEQITVADAFNGEIHFVSPIIDISAPAPSSTQYASAFFIDDTNGENLTRIETFRRTADTICLRFGARRVINDVVRWNQFDILLASDGTQSYAMSNPEAFRNAIGFADSEWLSLPANSTVYTGTIYYRRIGKWVAVNLYQIKLVSELTSASGIALNNLPSGYRPDHIMPFAAGNTSSGMGLLWISTSGNLQFFKPAGASSFPTTQNIYGTCMFFV